MSLKKFLRSTAVVIALLVSGSPCAEAEIYPVEVEEYYTMDTHLNETFKDAEENVREKAFRAAAEKAGVYVESITEVKNMQLTRDKITIVAAHYLEDVKVEIIPAVSDDGKSYKMICKLTAKVDTNKVDPKKILEKETQIEDASEKNKRVKEIEAERDKYKTLYEQANSELQKKKFQDEFTASQKQFLIAKYERDLDVYDFGGNVDWQGMTDTAQKLSDIDPQNAMAFRANIYALREQDNFKKVVDLCNKVLRENSSPEIAIEACAQLGDIYYNEFNDKETARKFVNQGIAMVKKQYAPSMINKLVNGTNVYIDDGRLVGKTNTIRELYVLKSDIENATPHFKQRLVATNDFKIIEAKIYDIEYRIDW